MYMVDLETLAERLGMAKDTVRKFWTELPYVRIPGSKGTDVRGARFIVDDVVQYLKDTSGVNYGDLIVQDKKGGSVSGRTVHRRKANSDKGRVSDKKRGPALDRHGRAKLRAVCPGDDPHGLLDACR
jgi:hypothetical protein